jgi:hypothetical protein
MLIHHVHDVTLIFGHIVTAQKFPDIVFLHNSRVVSSGHCIKTQNNAALMQTIELQVTVAFDTRVGRNSDGMIVDIWLNHIAVKIFGEVKDQVINSELLSNSTSIINIAHAATAGVAVATPEAHRDADNVMALFKQQCSSNRRINATRHRDQNLHGFRDYGDSARLGFEQPHR